MTLDLFSDSSHSLKEKRHIISSVKEKLKNKFNISLIESDYHNLWQKIQISIAMLSMSKVIIEKSFDQMEDFVSQNYPVRVVSANKEFI